jgi:hypothetical protein
VFSGADGQTYALPLAKPLSRSGSPANCCLISNSPCTRSCGGFGESVLKHKDFPDTYLVGITLLPQTHTHWHRNCVLETANSSADVKGCPVPLLCK